MEATYFPAELNRPDGTVMHERPHSEVGGNASRRILEAARTVAMREGAGKVTIESVAREAGLSKGGVLYNYPSKKALLAGLLDQMLTAHRELFERLPENQSSRTLRGHLETIVQTEGVDDLSMAILAAAASDPQLLDPLRKELTGDIERILSETQDAPAAMIAALAIQGLRFQRLLKLPDGGADLKRRVVERLRTMIDELEEKTH